MVINSKTKDDNFGFVIIEWPEKPKAKYPIWNSVGDLEMMRNHESALNKAIKEDIKNYEKLKLNQINKNHGNI